MKYDENTGKITFNEEEHKLLKKIAEIQKEQYEVAKRRVNTIIKNKIKDEHEIEATLDILFEFLEDDDALLLYRKLCRYYWDINQQATIDYIYFYIEEYDPEHKKFGNKEEKQKENKAKQEDKEKEK